MATKGSSAGSWMQGRVEALLTALSGYGMNLSPAAAQDLIAERVESVAELMRTTKATARTYLTDETIAGMAESIAFSLAEESPGADLYDAPRTAAVPVGVVGRIVAGLAEVCQIRFAERDDPEHAEHRVTEVVRCLSVLGAIASMQPPELADLTDVSPGVAPGVAHGGPPEVTIAFPPALLRRAPRYLDAAAATADDGVGPAGYDGDLAALAKVFRDDAVLLRVLAEAARGGPGDDDPPARAHLRAL